MPRVETAPRDAPQSGFWHWHILFRCVAIGLFALFGIATGLWKSILTPWLVLSDSSDHGWPRTAELHRVGDTAGAALLALVAIGAVLSAIRPAEHSGIGAWVTVTLMIIVTGQIWSTVVQEHSGVAGAVLTSGIFLALTAVPYVALHPRRHDVLRGGAPDPQSRPRGVLRVLLWVLMLTGAVFAAGAVAWRLTGGTFEDRREDDAVGLVMLGLVLALGCALCLNRRQGWRPLAALLLSTAGYCIVGGLFLVR